MKPLVIWQGTPTSTAVGHALIERIRTVFEALKVLEALKVDSKRRRDWFRLLFKRGEVQAAVNECRRKMQVAKEKFNVRYITSV